MAQAAIPLMVVTAAGQLAGGFAQRAEANAAARVDDENARLTILEGEQNALQTRRDERSIAGDMIAAMAGSGTLLDGSNADLLAQSAYQREVEIGNIRRQSSAEARNLQREAKAKRRAGRNALIGAGFNAVSTALGGMADIRANRLLAAQGSRERGATLSGAIKIPGRSVPAMSSAPEYSLAYGGAMRRTVR